MGRRLFIAVMIVWWALLIAGWVVFFVRQRAMEFVPAPDDLRQTEEDLLSEHVTAPARIIGARGSSAFVYSPTT